jgi:hypothetical protein
MAGLAVFEFSASWISGMVLGLEHHAGENIDEQVEWAITLDLFIIRLALVCWKEEF